MAALIGIVNIFGETEWTPPDNVALIRAGRKATVVHLKAGGSIYTHIAPATVASLVMQEG